MKTLTPAAAADPSIYKNLLEKALTRKNYELEKIVPIKPFKENETGQEMTSVNSDQKLSEDKLIKWIRPNVDIQKRLFDKLNDLTDLLLQIATDDMVKTLKNDPTIMNSGMGKLIDDVYTTRQLNVTGSVSASMSRKLGRFGRGVNRATNGQFLQQQLINELTLVNGFFMLMKAQYDMTIDYYERSMDSDKWKEIWQKYIQNSSVYIEYLVPSDISEKIKEGRLNISKEDMELASTKAIEVSKENDEDKTRNDNVTGVASKGGKRYRFKHKNKSKKVKGVKGVK